jgi:hypothetical protein
MNPDETTDLKLINDQLIELVNTLNGADCHCDKCSDRSVKGTSRKVYLAGPMKPLPFKKVPKRARSTEVRIGPLERVTF